VALGPSEGLRRREGAARGLNFLVPHATRPVEWIVLGSGTSLPTPTRGSPGHLLRMADGRGVLVDPGPGSVRAAARMGVLAASLRAVIVTHFHVDHVLDVFALIFALRNPALAQCKLTVIGPTGIADLVARGRQVFGTWVELPPERLEFVELEPGPFTVALEAQRLEGVALRMPHLGHSLGYRVRGHARTVAYSGDTGLGDAPVELGRGSDVFVLEAALPEGSDTTRHLTPSHAARIATQAGCKELVLTHFYPDTDRTDVRAIVREHWTGPLVLAHDGLRIPL
jgi:ribonuclease BN (tRNA processing enzyme)